MCPDTNIERIEKLNLEQLKIVNNLRIHEDQLCWTVFSIFWAATALLLVALFQSSDLPFIFIKWILIPVFGLFLSIIWFIILFRALDYLQFYEKIVRDLEEHLIDIKFQTNRKNTNFEKCVRGCSVRPIMKTIPIVMIFAWVLILGIGFGLRIGFSLRW
jgi:phosphate/sulfate permease